MKVGGKELSVRVEDAPDVQAKRKHYWRAVDAIEGFGSEDTEFVLAPRSFGIHEPVDMELMGHVTNDGYVWCDSIVKKALPEISMLELKKRTLNLGKRR